VIDSLYVHIPFCSNICSYCDFCKLIYNDKFAFLYVEELKKEISSYKYGPYKTIYIGGGTPSSLIEESLENLLSFLRPYLENNGEFTIEVNPENITLEKLQIMKKYGINRISIGMQTSSEEYLKLINRAPFDVFLKAYNLIREVGFSNVNIDLMYALPNESIEIVKKDLKTILELDPEHISTYSLILEENSVFSKKGFKEEDQDVQASQYELILSTLRDAGYRRYEVSNFAKKGRESRHNLTYWKDKEYVGCGLGASGFIGTKRYTNTRSLSTYLKGKYIETSEEVNFEESIKYFFLTNLRLDIGFSLDEFKQKFGFDFLEKYQSQYGKLYKENLLFKEDGWIKPTDKGILLLDRILVDLF